MKDQKDLAIGVLSVTSVIMFVGVMIIQTRPETAYASGMTESGGDYILAVGTIQRATNEEVLYVIDKAEQKLIVYSCDVPRRNVNIMDIVDLEKLRQNQPKSAPQSQKSTPTQRGATPPVQRGGSRPTTPPRP